MIRLLVFGSSARRGATGWTDAAKIRDLYAAVRPDVVIHGASPAGGADALADEEARAAGLQAHPCPVDTTIDGPWPRAGMRRNERMFATLRPTLAAGFISGAVGTPMSSGSKYMMEICRDGYGRDRRPLGPPVALVIYRDNGVEPLIHALTNGPGIGAALDQIIRLYVLTRDPELVPVGRAIRTIAEANGRALDVDPTAALAAIRFAADTAPRWAPWLAAIEATVLATQKTTAGGAPPDGDPTR